MGLSTIALKGKEAISTGSSSGLLRFQAEDGGEAMREAVESCLNRADQPYHHANLVDRGHIDPGAPL